MSPEQSPTISYAVETIRLNIFVILSSLWVRSDYTSEISSLGTLYDDVWTAQSTGQSDTEIRNWIISILKDFAQN